MILSNDAQFFDNVAWFVHWQNVRLGVLIKLIFKWTLGPTVVHVATEMSVDRRVVDRMVKYFKNAPPVNYYEIRWQLAQ